MADDVKHIYLALVYTDFRKQINGLSFMVALQFKLDSYAGKSLFLFCNKRRTSIIIGKKKVRSEIEFIPAKVKVTEYVQYIYKCYSTFQ
jgi:hypothetical protein